MLTPTQESSLTSAGDCFEHWHSSDRVLSHDSVLALQSASLVFTRTDDFLVSPQQDFIQVDTTLKSITITLPVSTNGREIEISKVAPANVLIIKTTDPNRILGSNEIRVYNYGTSLRFKAIPTGWIII